MARSRNIKPGFFLNDALGGLPALTRLLFAGLWTICDRAGRVEDRPKKIKAEVLPYDDCNADEMLESLMNSGFILRYEANGIKVIQVISWAKHQNPHIKEAVSTLPAYIEHGVSTVQEQCKEQPTPERAGLIPDSGFLIPDSLKDGSKLQSTQSSHPDGFDSFWLIYPKKVGKPAAIKAFKAAKLNGHLSDVLSDIESKKVTEAWKKDSGQFIPNPATYLNQRRWEDVPTEVAMDLPKPDKDPALEKIERDKQICKPMPAAIREQLARFKAQV